MDGRGRAVPKKKKLFVSGFTNRPDQKSYGLNPGDSAKPDTTRKFLVTVQVTVRTLRELSKLVVITPSSSHKSVRTVNSYK
jgi:hypothetical protein